MNGILYFIILLIVFIPDSSFALKCKDVSESSAFALYDSVILGRVIGIVDYQGTGPNSALFGKPTKQIKFEVNRSWKGAKAKFIDVLGFSLKDMWDIHFKNNNLYIVYLKQESDFLVFPVCGISKPVSLDDKSISILDELAKKEVRD